MNSPTHSMSFSGRKHFMTSSRCQLERPAKVAGSSAPHGCSASVRACHSAGDAPYERANSCSASTRWEMVQMRVHWSGSACAGRAGRVASSTMPAPMRKRAHSTSLMSPRWRMMAVAIMKEKVILCSPKRPRETLL